MNKFLSMWYQPRAEILQHLRIGLRIQKEWFVSKSVDYIYKIIQNSKEVHSLYICKILAAFGRASVKIMLWIIAINFISYKLLYHILYIRLLFTACIGHTHTYVCNTPHSSFSKTHGSRTNKYSPTQYEPYQMGTLLRNNAA